jgi:hypothetical protein
LPRLAYCGDAHCISHSRSFAGHVAGGQCSTITPEGAAQSVIDLVNKQNGFEPKDVKCPDGVDANVGTDFECRFTGPDGDYTAHLRVTKVEGDDVEFYIQTRPSKG